MKLELLEIGVKTEQLGSCHLSLLLGVLTSENRIADFLKFACGMLQVNKGILVFKEEPYGWHVTPEHCHAFVAQAHEEFEHYFLNQPYIDCKHPNYKLVSNYIIDRGVEHQRYIAISMKNNNESIGHVVLFDEKVDEFEEKQLKVVLEFVQSLVNVIKLRLENAELKELYEQQSALNYSKTKFFQIIAHDLRAPFHGLLGFSDVLVHERETLNDDGIQDIAEYLHDTAQSTYNLLESLLNWAMAEGGRFVYHPISFDLNQSVDIVISVLSGLATKKSIQLETKVVGDVKVFADINMITSVIQNLVSNALKFTHTDGSGKVVIQVFEAADAVEIHVKDSGLGMSQTQINNLFEPKITISINGTAGEKGTGLGLVLCKRFVELNHGQIEVESKEGCGSVFKVKLPKTKQAIQDKSPIENFESTIAS